MRVPLLRFVLVALVAPGPACSPSERAPAPSARQKPAVVATPANLIAEVTIPEPRRLWAAVRKLGGSRAEVLPVSWELGLFGLIDLPPRIAGFVRPETPILGVVLAQPKAPPVGIFAVRVVSGGELVDALTRGEGAPLRVERDGSGVTQERFATVLVGSKPTPVLGVLDDWLFVAGDVVALRSAGAYVARGLGTRVPSEAPLTIDVSRAALAGPITEGARSGWATLRAGLSEKEREARAARGREADFGDPAAILGIGDGVVDALLGLLASTERVRLTLRPDDDHLELSLTASGAENGALARLVENLEVGPLDPLLGLPSSVLGAALSRSTEAERRLAAEKPADALRSVLGPRLAEKDAAPLADALRSFHRGRGDVVVCGVFADRSLFLRQSAREPKELERGLRGLLRQLRVPALSGPLEPLLGRFVPRESTTRVPGLEGPVHRIELVQKPPKTPGIEVLVHVKDSNASVVASPRASVTLVALAKGADTLGRSPALARLTEGGVPVSAALYADLSLLRPPGGPAPALAVLGKKGKDAVLEVELSAPACAALVELAGTP